MWCDLHLNLALTPPTCDHRPMRWVTQLNIRLDDDTDSELSKEAEKAGSTRSQIAREAIKKELERRKRSRKLERDLELLEKG